MKLLRFELASSPGQTRSGIVHGNKVYETDGVNAIAVHEWPEVVPFIPTGLPPSYRMFRTDQEIDVWAREEGARPLHQYLNPASLLAPNRVLPKPLMVGELAYEPQIAAIVASAGRDIAVEEADGFILGFTVLNTLVAAEDDAREKDAKIGPGRSRDIGTAAGPFLTTPEELDDAVIDEQRGRRYKLGVTVRINGEEVAREDLSDLPYTFAELVSFASETSALAPGDLIGYGPVGIPKLQTPNPKLQTARLEPGDEVSIVIDRLGALVTRIS